MWIFLSNAFLSIVAPAHYDSVDPAEFLKVRARFKGDIESVFPGVRVKRSPDADYLYRAFVERDRVADVLAAQVMNDLNYENFKNTVKEHGRHITYLRVWNVMSAEQDRREPPPPKVWKSTKWLRDDPGGLPYAHTPIGTSQVQIDDTKQGVPATPKRSKGKKKANRSKQGE